MGVAGDGAGEDAALSLCVCDASPMGAAAFGAAIWEGAHVDAGAVASMWSTARPAHRHTEAIEGVAGCELAQEACVVACASGSMARPQHTLDSCLWPELMVTTAAPPYSLVACAQSASRVYFHLIAHHGHGSLLSLVLLATGTTDVRLLPRFLCPLDLFDSSILHRTGVP